MSVPETRPSQAAGGSKDATAKRNVDAGSNSGHISQRDSLSGSNDSNYRQFVRKLSE